MPSVDSTALVLAFYYIICFMCAVVQQYVIELQSRPEWPVTKVDILPQYVNTRDPRGFCARMHNIILVNIVEVVVVYVACPSGYTRV